MASQEGRVMSYIPEPHERNYYEALFHAADTKKQGFIGGAEAVQFFQRSQLPVDALKHVWTLADQPSTNYLDRQKFAVALRFIQLLQNGVKGEGPDLKAPPGMNLKPVYFQGVSGVSIPLPQQGPPPQNGSHSQQQRGPPVPPQHSGPPQQQNGPPQQRGPPSQQSGPPQNPQQHQNLQYQQQPQGGPPQQHNQQPYQGGPPPPGAPSLRGGPPPSGGSSYSGGPTHSEGPPQSGGPPQHHLSQGSYQSAPSTLGSNPAYASQGQKIHVVATPPRPNIPPSTSLALTPQDPYTLTPQDQVRYEDLFPQYSKPDGYVYGEQARDLFAKSGLGQEKLAAIWNMVDTPVDNRLDKIEFCIAMHLIVCISRKGLPMPQNGLPLCLKLLKSQQQSPQRGGPTPQPQQQSYGIPNQSSQNPSQTSMQQLPQQQAQYSIPSNQSASSMQQHQHQQPPPLTSIQYQQPPPLPTTSDQQHRYYSGSQSVASVPQAPSTPLQNRQFSSSYSVHSEQPGLATMQQQNSQPPSVVHMTAPPLQQQEVRSISDAFEGLSGVGGMKESTLPSISSQQQQYQRDDVPTPINDYSLPEPEDVRNNFSQRIPSPTSNVQSSNNLHQQRYNQSDRLSPPNTQQLASKYDMGDAHVELEKLKGVLQKLKAENISLKAQMGSMTEEEKNVHRELSATIAEISKMSSELVQLRSQVASAKSLLLEATAELKAAQEKKGVLHDLIDEAKEVKRVINEAHESIERANEITAAAAAAAAPTSAPVVSSFDDDLFGFGNEQNHNHSLGSKANGSLESLPKAQAYGSNNFSGVPSSYGVADKSRDISPRNIPQPNLTGNAQTSHKLTLYDDDDDDEDLNEGGKQADEPTSMYHFSQPPLLDNRPATMHERDVSTASGFDFSLPMGGTPSYGVSSNSFDMNSGPSTSNNAYESSSAPSKEDINDLKRRAAEAEDIAREAEESYRQLKAQVDELRRVADKADAESRQQAASLADTKQKKNRGFLSRGKGKKDAQEVERMSLDAKAKKDQLLQAEAQAQDAKALAEETRSEANRIRQEAEDVELQAAKVASRQTIQPTNSNGYNMPNQSFETYGGGSKQNQSSSPWNPSIVGSIGSRGSESPDFAHSNVMGSGNMEIPEPTNDNNYDYGNPFG